jgi:ribosome-associated protein
MEQESDRIDGRNAAGEIARFLDEAGARNTIALDISAHSGFADAFVIADTESRGRLQGLHRRTDEKLRELGLSARNFHKRADESGWLLLDCGSVIVHLMLEEQRAFYDLERLWYDAEVIWEAESTR